MTRTTGLAALTAGAALLAAAPPPATAAAMITAPTSAIDPLAPLLALLALVAWALLAWLLVVALATTATRLPGSAGRAAGRFARRSAPAGVRRLVELSLGLTVAVGALGVSPASAGTHIPPVPPAASLDWPVAPVPSVAPALDWNAAPVPAEAPAPATVVVQPGDSLWKVAADHLPAGATNAQIAQSWPTWWSANRSAIGPEPDLIHPGLSLTPPAQAK